MSADVNTNLAAYAHSLGLEVSALPTGAPTNARFMGWITEQADIYAAETGETIRNSGKPWFDRFNAWLTTQYPAPVPGISAPMAGTRTP